MSAKSLILYSLLFIMLSMAIISAFERRRILYRRCYAGATMPQAVFMSCANAQGPCEVRKGSTHTLRAIFRPTVNSSSVDSYVVWKNGWFPIPLPGQTRSVCESSIPCPVEMNEITQFTYNLTIDNFWPQGEYPVEWTLTDEDTGDELVCFQFKVLIA